MFDSASLDHRIDKDTYKKEEPKLREALLNAQFDLAQSKRFPVLILVGGVEGAGKGETINLLNEWMDPRHLVTRAFAEPSEEERERPYFWRFWRGLPPKGRIGIFHGAWHTLPILHRVWGESSKAELEEEIVRVNRFERMLANEGVLLVKFWLHLTKKQQKKRLKSLAADPDTAWRVTEQEWKYARKYDDFVEVSEHFVRQTSTGEAPWHVVAGADEQYRALTVGKTILSALAERLEEKPSKKAKDTTPALLPSIDKTNVLRALKLDKKLGKEKYEKELEHWQGRLALAVRHKRFAKRSLVCVFEGNDAAGKGGAIRRVTQALDARQYHTVPIAAPTEEERAQPYLWRFWRHVPRRGKIVIFDRSWYGRVLVERVEGFCSEADWLRAYSELNDFEAELGEHGAVVVKLFLSISQDEQLRRFKERAATSFKRFKITDEDWRNRKKWGAYEAAICDMVDRTSTEEAPWTLVEANDKYFARLKVLKTVTQAVEAALER